MTDGVKRRQAANLVAQINGTAKDRREVVGYMLAMLPFLDGEDDKPQVEAAQVAPYRPSLKTE